MKTLIFFLLCLPGSSYFPAYGVAPTNTSIDISNNYWGGLIPPSAPTWSYFWNYNFTSSSTSSLSYASGLGCSDDITMKQKGVKPLSIATDTDTCSVAFPDYIAQNNTNFQYSKDYDTMRYWYIPHCYPIAEASQTAGALSGSAQIGVVLTNFDSVLNCRAFMIHCLTLRNDDEWFCAFLAAVAGTFVDSNDIYKPNYREERAIAQYLVNNPRCSDDATGNSFEYQELLMTQENFWADTAHAGEVFDTTIPTMQQLGLDSVLIINGQAGVTYAVPTSQIILSASVLDNPFQNSTSILVSIGREAYVTIAVYNVLGVQIAGTGYAGVFEQGSRTIPLDMTSAPSGAYYVRISTAYNETQTLKLTKE
jgi:hypothetical protein